MKKSVIKRRKRVPAAGPAGQQMPSPGQGVGRSQGNRMSDQAAAEALVSVGRSAQDRSGGEETTEDEQDQRSRKKSRRGPAEMDMEEDTGLYRERRHEREPKVWGDEQRQGSPFGAFTVEGSGAQTSRFGSGYELPPLNPALVSGEKSRYQYQGTSSSAYGRTDSAAPSRTHSPVAHHTGAQGASTASSSGGYHLPPPHSLTSGHGPFYGSGGTGALRTSSPRAPSPLRDGGNVGGIPTLGDLEHHYHQLDKQRRIMQDMLDKTDRMMAGVKRGIEEMRQPGGGGNAPASSSAAPSLPLTSRSERRDGSNVWPIVPQDSQKRD